MTGRREAALTRAVAAVLLVALAFTAVFSLRPRAASAFLSPMEDSPADSALPGGIRYSDTDAFVYDSILEADSKFPLDRGFIKFCSENARLFPDGGFSAAARRYISASGYSDRMWEVLTGITLPVLYDIYKGADAGVTFLGDVYDTHKTVVAVASTAALPAADGSADVTLTPDTDGVPDARYYISGGIKFAVCPASAAEDAAARADAVLAVADGADSAAVAAASGADVVICRGPSAAPEYIGGTPVIYGPGDGAVITVTFAVGITPVVRLFPCSGGRLLSGSDADGTVADLNTRSATAYIDGDNRIREK